MGRIGKQKRLIIESKNKMLLGESMIDIDNVLHLLKFKFGLGDIASEHIDEFDNWVGEIKDRMTDEEYATLFNDWLLSDDMGENYNEYIEN